MSPKVVIFPAVTWPRLQFIAKSFYAEHAKDNADSLWKQNIEHWKYPKNKTDKFVAGF